MVVVRLLRLNPLQYGLVLVSHKQQVPLSSSLVQTDREKLRSLLEFFQVCLPSLLVVVDVVHAALGPHDAGHLVQKYTVISLYHAPSLFFHL